MARGDRFGTPRLKETDMDLGSWLIPCALALCATIAVLVARGASRDRKGDRKAAPERTRRAGGHALLALREFIEPGIEHVEQVAEERRREDDQEGDDGNSPSETGLRNELLASLSHSPVDRQEVRRLLTTARRAGFDWRRLYAEAVEAVLTAQPYQAPFLPPIERVTPWADPSDD
jgi:hypothetical protein